MFTIHSYTDTRCELEIAKHRLRLLTDKKEKLYCNYFPITSKLKEITVDEEIENDGKMAAYLHELHEKDIGTGKSLAEELIYQQQIVNKLQGYLNDMSESLSKMSGIEYRLYYDIIVNGTRISKAIEKIANETDKDTQTIWKNYYRKIKKEVKKVIRFSSENYK